MCEGTTVTGENPPTHEEKKRTPDKEGLTNNLLGVRQDH